MITYIPFNFLNMFFIYLMFKNSYFLLLFGLRRGQTCSLHMTIDVARIQLPICSEYPPPCLRARDRTKRNVPRSCERSEPRAGGRITWGYPGLLGLTRHFSHRPFSMTFLTSSWNPFFLHFGANLAPTCLPTWR